MNTNIVTYRNKQMTPEIKKTIVELNRMNEKKKNKI